MPNSLFYKQSKVFVHRLTQLRVALRIRCRANPESMFESKRWSPTAGCYSSRERLNGAIGKCVLASSSSIACDWRASDWRARA
eukprot:6992961-Pyramimonas_sp.AAC.1